METKQIFKNTLLVFYCFYFMNAGAQTNWTSRSTAGFNYRWQSVTHDGAKFLAVGRPTAGFSTLVMTSTDGFTWSSSTTNLPTVNMNDVIFANGNFIAACSFVQGSGADQGIRIATSANGTSWTVRSTPNTDWQSLAFGNNRVVAVGSVENWPSTVKAMTSDDGGLTWTGRPSLPLSNIWTGVAFGAGKFVAVSTEGNGSPNIVYSNDGITWTGANVPSGNPTFWSVAFGNNRFVAVSQSGVAATSTDGINWTAANTPGGNKWRDVIYGAGKYVAVSDSGSVNRAMVSEDGINWFAENSASNNMWTGLAFENNMFVAVSSTGSGNRVMTRDGSIAPLPVSLLSFSGRAADKEVHLNWVTASEQNSSHFEVERSANGKDYTAIGHVKAGGNSFSILNYQFKDVNSINGSSYYRLKQVDVDGKFTYSHKVFITMRGGSEAIIGPNPSEAAVTLHLPGDWTGVYEYKIHDMKGQLLECSGGLHAGSNHISLNKLVNGKYLLTLWENGELRQQKWLLKQ
ncbi:MAG: T9SS type A sorting domain-containing protein [Sphingomonadales bacterium]|jgi:hypothetical protein